MRQSKSFDEMKTFDQTDFNPSSAMPVIPKPATGLSRSTSSQMMPPPPPRPPRGGLGANTATSSGIPSEISNQLSTSAPASGPSPLSVSPSHLTSSHHNFLGLIGQCNPLEYARLCKCYMFGKFYHSNGNTYFHLIVIVNVM